MFSVAVVSPHLDCVGGAGQEVLHQEGGGDTELERNTSFPVEETEADAEKVKLEFELIQET